MRRYFGAQWKRALRSLPGALLANFLLLAAAALLLLYLTRLFAPSEAGTAKLKLGIVGGQGQTYLGTGLGILNNMDSSRLAISYEQLDKEAAAEKLKRGEIQAYLEVPDDFLSALSEGENKTIRYVGGGLEAGLNSALIREAGSAAEVILKETERGIYAAEGYFDAHGAAARHEKLLTELNLRYLALVLNRNQAYRTESVRPLRDVSLPRYYAAALLCFLFFSSGVSALPFATGRSRVLGSLLSAAGLSRTRQLLSEYAAYFLLQLLACLPLIVILREKFPGIFPVLCTATAFQFLLYELATGLLAGAFLQLLAGITVSFVSGCFYPLAFFPDRWQQISRALPSGQCFSYLQNLTAGSSVEALLWQGAGLLFFALLFLLLAALCRAGRRQA
mgnify:CR=1 FL=1